MYGDAVPTTPGGLRTLGVWIPEVFNLWLERWPVWLLQGLIYSTLLFVVQTLINRPFGAVFTQPPSSPRYWTVLFVQIVVGLILAAYLEPGIMLSARKQLFGREIQVSDLFSGTRYFLPALGTLAIIRFAGVIIAPLSCCIGSFVIAVLSFLALPVLVFQDVGPISALRRSWQIVQAHFGLFVAYILFFVLVEGLMGITSYSLARNNQYLTHFASVLIETVSIIWSLLSAVVAYEHLYHPGMNPPLGTSWYPYPPPAHSF